MTKIIVESASYRQQRCVLAYVTCHSKIEYSFGNVAMPNGEKIHFKMAYAYKLNKKVVESFGHSI